MSCFNMKPQTIFEYFRTDLSLKKEIYQYKKEKHGVITAAAKSG